MKTFAILLPCVSFLAAAQFIGTTTLAFAAESSDITPHLHVKESIVPIKRQDAGLPPVCWNACLMGTVSEVGTCELFDTPCVCGDKAILASTVDCLSKTYSQSDFPLAVAVGDSLCAPYEPASDPSSASSVSAVETGSSLVLASPSSVNSATASAILPTFPPPEGNGIAPGCYNACLQSAVSEAGTCEIFDTPCICNDTPILALFVDCANTTCSELDFPLAAKALNTLCGFTRESVESIRRMTASISATTTVGLPATVAPTSTATISTGAATAASSATIVSSATVPSSTGSTTSGALEGREPTPFAALLAAVVACVVFTS